jgi:hypothetical protein
LKSEFETFFISFSEQQHTHFSIFWQTTIHYSYKYKVFFGKIRNLKLFFKKLEDLPLSRAAAAVSIFCPFYFTTPFLSFPNAPHGIIGLVMHSKRRGAQKRLTQILGHASHIHFE